MGLNIFLSENSCVIRLPNSGLKRCVCVCVCVWGGGGGG